MLGLPGHDWKSYQTAAQLYRLVNRIAKRHRKQFPATAVKLRKAASNIGGKLGRSAVPCGGPTMQLCNRSKALKRARFVQRTLRMMWSITSMKKPDPEITAALELVERVVDLIQTGQ
jgi:hypothetical protein